MGKSVLLQDEPKNSNVLCFAVLPDNFHSSEERRAAASIIIPRNKRVIARASRSKNTPTTYTMKFLCALASAGLLLSGASSLAQTTPTQRLDSVAHRASIAKFQKELNQEFCSPKESPLSAEERRAFKTLPYYPVDYRYYVVARLVRDPTSQMMPMVTTTARQPLGRKYGDLFFTIAGQPLKLTVYQSQDITGKPGYSDYLLLAFADLTNGHGSYGGGRILDLRIPAAGSNTILLDFNRAYNPSCAYSPRYSCPVPPPENRLSVAIPAGVRSDH